MKKRSVILIIVVLFLFASGIIVLDYYRSIYVSSKVEEKEYSDKLDDVSDVFVQEESQTKENSENGIVKFCFLGDNLIHENVLNYANLQAGGLGYREDYDKGFEFKPLYQKILPLIEQTDFTVCNQASLVGASDVSSALSGYPLFNSPSKLGKDLIEVGFDGVNIGNNHLLDMGYDGLKNSIEFWKTQNIAMFGGYLSEEEKKDSENKLIEINGIRFSFLSFTANTNGIYSENGNSVPYFTLRGTEIMKAMLEEQVLKCKELSDVVIVMINWANTAGFEVTDFQKTTAQILCDAGADIIIGSGPKTIQEVEWLISKDERKTLCAYSLGNLMGTMQYTENLLGGALTFNVKKDKNFIEIKDVLFHPTVIHYNDNFSDIYVVPLENYSKEEFLLHGSNIHYGQTDFSVLLDIIKKNIPLIFLTNDLK